jgi:hypothetical protein
MLDNVTCPGGVQIENELQKCQCGCYNLVINLLNIVFGLFLNSFLLVSVALLVFLIIFMRSQGEHAARKLSQ